MRLRRSHTAIGLASALGLAATIACGSFSGTSSGTPDEGGTSSSAEAGTSSSADAATSSPNDGGASAIPFCDTERDASFCWSFDAPDYLRGPYLQPSSKIPPVLTDAALSAPFAMMVGPDAGDTSFLQFTKTAHTSIRCDADIIVDQPGAGGANVIWITPHFQSSYALLFESNGGNVSAKAAIDLTSETIANVPTANWTHIAIAASLGTTLHAEGFVNNLSTTVDKPTTDGGPQTFQDFDVTFGLTFAANGWVIRYDNLTCTWD